MQKAFVVTNDQGRQFYVKVLEHGDTYGLSAIWDHEELGVTFFDLTYAYGSKFWGAEGQSTGATYYLETLLDHHYGAGLDLVGYAPEWKIDGESFKSVLDFLTNVAIEVDKKSKV